MGIDLVCDFWEGGQQIHFGGGVSLLRWTLNWVGKEKET